MNDPSKLEEQLDILLQKMNSFLDRTSLKFDIVNKLRKELFQIVQAIKPDLSFTNRLKSIPFERNMDKLASICRRVVFASNSLDMSIFQDKEAIYQFFLMLNYPIDLCEQFFDDDFALEDEDIVYFDACSCTVFDKTP